MTTNYLIPTLETYNFSLDHPEESIYQIVNHRFEDIAPVLPDFCPFLEA